MTFKEVFKEIDYKYIFCVVFMKAIVPIVIRALGISADKLGEAVENWFDSIVTEKKFGDNKSDIATNNNHYSANDTISIGVLHNSSEITELNT